ncbi:unnamed protein product [Urochloa humidicola]
MAIVSPRRAAVVMIGFQLLMTAQEARVALPGCPESCGKVQVPYPFGIGDGCFYEGFNLTCDETKEPAMLLLADGMEVYEISLEDGTVSVSSKILLSNSTEFNGTWSGPAAAGPFMLSLTYNLFIALGCNILARLIPNGLENFNSTCVAMCMDNFRDYNSDSVCSGLGSCRAPIMEQATSYFIEVTEVVLQKSMRTDSSENTGNRAAFIVDKAWFSTYGVEINLNTSNRFVLQTVPVVLEWWLDPTWRCIGSNPHIYANNSAKADNQTRRGCICSEGYQGNPYISNGCQDIDECQQPGAYPCHGTCINVLGTYRCSSGKSLRSLTGLITIIAISSGSGVLFALMGVAKISNKLKQQRDKEMRRKFFKRNHGLLLQQLISSNDDVAERMKIFNIEELDQATNKFDQTRILGGGGHGMVYKGILSDQRVVAIKKSKIVVQREIDQFINEVVILSQTNHRNVVKLFGCCLEAEVPLLVYEFISNGTLSYHLHEQSEKPLSWKDRLRIALEIARAIGYLHFAASISVFHRDIKSANILLTNNLTAKISDFGASRSISIDETGILTGIQGTHGYLDPEYYYTSRLTEKSDVYSFGVILAELLTRIKPVFSSHSSEFLSLASHFVSLKRDDCLWDILDPQIVEEGEPEDVEVVATLAEACLSLTGEERPTMRQVETTLEDVQGSNVVYPDSQITRSSQNAPKYQPSKRNKGGEGTRLYSLEKEFMHSSEIPR